MALAEKSRSGAHRRDCNARDRTKGFILTSVSVIILTESAHWTGSAAAMDNKRPRRQPNCAGSTHMECVFPSSRPTAFSLQFCSRLIPTPWVASVKNHTQSPIHHEGADRHRGHGLPVPWRRHRHKQALGAHDGSSERPFGGTCSAVRSECFLPPGE